jgi:hypothetical protein
MMSTDVTYTAQLAVFVRGIHKDFQSVVKLLDLVPMEGTSDADELFSELVALFSKYESHCDKKFWFPVDEAPAVIGRIVLQQNKK